MYMNNDKIFNLLVEVVFNTSHQLVRIEPKAKDLVDLFQLTEG